MSDKEELLFFDTFAHENSEELNLDLVQFTKPVYVTEVRIIPLGARVQADFPGGVRLGATNPSQFQIEFFVNDLGKPGASTFESLGGFEYNQNGCINLECLNNGNSRKIPTDGLVLRGLYTTITLAVYGKLTANITEQIIQPVVNPTLPAQPNTIPDVQQISAIENEWPSQEQIQSVPIEYPQQNATQQYPATAYVSGQDQYNQEYNEYYNEVPKDPRSYHHTPEAEWENKTRGRSSERDREHNNQDRDRRDGEREKRYTRSQSRDRERNGSRDYREPSREREWSERDKRHEYRERDKDWERERDRDRYGKHQDYKRGYARDERDDTRKRPRTPPILSPKRPHTPHSERKETSPPEVDDLSEEDTNNNAAERREKETADVHQLAATASIAPVKGATPPKEVKDNVDEPPLMDVEEFEPILSDEDILDDNDHYHQEIDFDYTAYTNNDDLMKLFEPGTNDVQAYDDDNRPYEIRGDKIETSEELKVVIGIADDFFKSSITRFAIASFASLSKEFKEEFINLAEKIANTIGDIENFRTIVDIYTKTRGTNSKFDADSAEIVDSAKYVIETLLDWVEIASSYEMANAQDKPGYKIRHLKCGIQLLEWSCCSLDFVRLLWDRGFDIQTTLIDLYKQEYMAVSIRLMILRALDAYLHHKLTVERFLMYDATGKKMGNGFLDNGSLPENNGYQLTIELLRLNPSVRLKFALQSILKKLNLFEVTYRVQNCLAKYKSQDLDLDNIDFLAKALTQILQAIENGEFAFAQPKRFLPVAAQFEIQRDDTKPVIIKYFAMHKVLQCMLLMLNHPCTMNLTNVRTPIYQILEALSKNMSGLRYMCDNIDTINFLVKSLLQMQYEFQPAIEINSQRLGQEIAYKLQSLYHIDRLNSLGKRTNVDCESPDVIDQLHALYCLTLSKIGRIACAEVFALNDNVNAILRYVNVPRDKPEVQLVKLRKSPATGYVIDLLYNVFVYTTNTTSFIVANGKQLTNVVVHIRDGFDEAIVSKVNEIEQHLKPFDGFKPLNYDNIKPYVEIVNKHSDATVGYSGPLTSALRIIEHLGVSPHANGTPILNENPLNNYVELKYKHVILQLFSQGGVATLSAILEKICEHYEQPAVFASTFVSVHGVHLLNVIEPCVELLKQMLTYVIQCRNTSFKDLTTVPILLHTFNLLRHYPTTSAVYYRAQNVCGRLLATLLVYTQPISEEIHEKDSLNKTLWTLMCGEVIKFAAASPHTFVSGLSILSELLPLPLPVQSRVDLKADEVTWEINLRKLWSAHLHAHNAAMQDLINRLCVTAHQPLLNLLRRVCVQLADLAANSAITIARGLLDTIRNALTCDKDAGDENDGKSIVVSPCNGHVARLLNFLACLVTHANLKYAVLQLLQNHAGNAAKGDEKYPALVPLFLQILKTKSTQNAHVQSQECILSIVQSLCDTEITLMQNADGETVSSDVYLANALPTKETMLMFIDGMIEHAMADNGFLTCLPIVRTFLLLTEHDYGFYHLKENLMKKCVPLLPMLNKLDTNFAKDNAECLSTLNTLLEFLRVSSTIDEVEEGLQYKARTLKMSIEEIKGLIGWDNFKETDNDKKHPLINLETVLKKLAQEDATFETLLESLNAIVNLLNTSQSTDECKIVVVEPILPAPESLLAQFAGRPVYTTTEAISDERLTASYWLTVPTDETDADSENVTCDLIEICRQTLSQDVNLIREVEKICRICSASNGTEQNDSKEKPIDLQKEKLKRPFVTPSRGRGFPRTIQQRSDLFRSRPPNTSRPPSLHVDDFVALETCGAQPTGPTGYNRISREILATSRIARGTRGRAFVASERAVQYRQMHWWGSNLGRGPYQ